MASAANIGLAFDRAYREDFFRIADPGASGTFYLENQGYSIAQVVTAAAESRVLPSASSLGVGTELTVVFLTDGGDLTITGADQSVVLKDAGDLVTFRVGKSGTTNNWRVVEDSRVQSALFGSKTVDIPIGNNWRVWDSLITNLAAADGTDDLGLETGTFGTSAPQLNVTVATPTNAPFYAREPGFVVPFDYKAGTDLTLDVTVNQTTAATTATVDAVVVRRAAPGTDICATAAQSVIGASNTVYSFTLTGTNVVPGEVLDIRLAITLNDASATPEYDITKVNIDYTAG